MSKDQETHNQKSRNSDADRVDWLLEQLVIEANFRKSTFVSLTLNVGGIVVSGTLIGITEFYKSTIGIFHSGDDDPDEGTWGSYFKNLSDDEDGDTKPDENESASYIHLKNARIYSNDAKPMPSNQGVWWRGKISSVDAFWFGRLKSSDTDS